MDFDDFYREQREGLVRLCFVATTAQAAQEALGSAPLTQNPSAPVYLVVASGHFTCGGGCFNLTGHPSQGTVLGLVFDQPGTP